MNVVILVPFDFASFANALNKIAEQLAEASANPTFVQSLRTQESKCRRAARNSARLQIGTGFKKQAMPNKANRVYGAELILVAEEIARLAKTYGSEHAQATAKLVQSLDAIYGVRQGLLLMRVVAKTRRRAKEEGQELIRRGAQFGRNLVVDGQREITSEMQALHEQSIAYLTQHGKKQKDQEVINVTVEHARLVQLKKLLKSMLDEEAN